METPVLIWLGLQLFGLGISIEQHGKPKTGNHSFWVNVVSAAIGNTILYYGGFFA